ncbi:hypothetical protein IGI04_030031 [Brassica rapa subsp. trilocularis]|uniref:Uncharacterized protein n=1 Tax=Brassica rapa subsp. trilocularis TaxID=1813537 RepID=A0ABQ7LR44_BRACM|nr:hypothetical protein IGI04_030031 [Brassica rapa subsp. trilocularis]
MLLLPWYQSQCFLNYGTNFKPRLDPTQMGEAKNLVEMELDKSFPNLISCEDKQGNIYLVDVEYTWISSTCV